MDFIISGVVNIPKYFSKLFSVTLEWNYRERPLTSFDVFMYHDGKITSMQLLKKYIYFKTIENQGNIKDTQDTFWHVYIHSKTPKRKYTFIVLVKRLINDFYIFNLIYFSKFSLISMYLFYKSKMLFLKDNTGPLFLNYIFTEITSRLLRSQWTFYISWK